MSSFRGKYLVLRNYEINGIVDTKILTDVIIESEIDSRHDESFK